ncbi:hypothetical protein [Pseudooceanicola atlanticus]|uniref:hypothetical protein n=1 Tax=Pseudooceanicola atlanticus TaxID=1461694 RepID=UPI002354FEFC|nr:hypothetical protein [Pseudooceanicola atlanticus]
MTTSTITDTGDICRECRGYGVVKDSNGHGGMTTCRCDMCRGTGFKTVLVTKTTEGAAQ